MTSPPTRSAVGDHPTPVKRVRAVNGSGDLFVGSGVRGDGEERACRGDHSTPVKRVRAVDGSGDLFVGSGVRGDGEERAVTGDHLTRGRCANQRPVPTRPSGGVA